MCGVIRASGRMTGRLTLGYRDAVAATSSVLAPAGTPVRGHEFHRTTVQPGCSPAPAWRLGSRAEGFVQGSVHASYLHLHWAGQPAVAPRLVAAARAAAAGDTPPPSPRPDPAAPPLSPDPAALAPRPDSAEQALRPDPAASAPRLDSSAPPPFYSYGCGSHSNRALSVPQPWQTTRVASSGGAATAVTTAPGNTP